MPKTTFEQRDRQHVYRVIDQLMDMVDDEKGMEAAWEELCGDYVSVVEDESKDTSPLDDVFDMWCACDRDVYDGDTLVEMLAEDPKLSNGERAFCRALSETCLR